MSSHFCTLRVWFNLTVKWASLSALSFVRFMFTPFTSSARFLAVASGLTGSVFFFQTGYTFPIKAWDKLAIDSEQPSAPVEIQPGKAWKEPISGMMLLWIPGGCFKMGSPPGAEGRDADEGPVHPVCLSGFWLGEKEVTQKQWQKIMQQNPAKFRKDGSFPIESISRLDVETFTTKLNAFYQGRVRFDLPTEAQWEYACRNAGQKIPFPGYGQADQLSWYRNNSGDSTQTTGTRMANRLGLKDMSGNVWEWIRDTYDKATYDRHLTKGPNNDPIYRGAAPFSVIRGGGWGDTVSALRCANRGFEHFSSKRPDLGARLTATLDLDREGGIVRSDDRAIPF